MISPQPKFIARLAAAGVFLVGGLALLGWTLDIATLKSVRPDWATQAPLSAPTFLLAAISLWCLVAAKPTSAANQGGWLWRRISSAGAVLVVLVGCYRLADYVFGWNLHLEMLGFHDAPTVADPTHMAFATALAFILIGSALLLAGRSGNFFLFQLLVIATWLIGCLGMLRYLYGGEPLLPYAQMSAITAFCFLLLSAGVLCVRTEGGLMALILSDSPGGVLVRRILPWAWLLTFTIGWLRLKAQQAGWFGTEAGVSLYGLSNLIMFTALVWVAAILLNRAESQRRQAGEALRASKDRLRAYVEEAADSMFIHDDTGRFLDVNPQACASLGYRREELLGMNLFDIETVFDLPRSQAVWSRMVPGQPFILRGGLRRKDGSSFPVEVRLGCFDMEGQRCFFAMARDITERDQQEAATERALRRLIEAQRIGQIGDWEFDLGTGAITWSPQTFEILGRDPSLGPPQNYEENAAMYEPASAALMSAKVAAVIASGEPQEYELVALRPDGQRVSMQARAMPRKDGAGKVVALYGTVQDITERKLAEAALRQMAEMQMAILNALPAHIALVDAQGVIVAVNEAWRRFATANVLQGPEFCVGQNYLAVCEQASGDCSEEAKEAAAGLRRVLQGEAKEFAIEYPCHSPSEPRWFRLMVTPLRDDQRVGAVVMHVNVTERKLSENVVRESEERLTFAMEAAEIGDWDMDLRTNVARRSLLHDQCFGYAEMLPEWGYDTFLAHIEPADRHRVDASFRKAMAGQGDYDEEFRAPWPDGSVHWLWTKGRFYFDEAGQPYRVAGIVTDITERKSTEEAALRLAAIVESSDDAIIGKDLDGIVTSWNAGAEKVFGYSASEMVGQSIMRLIPPERHHEEMEILASVRRGEGIRHFDTVRVCKDGSAIDVSITVSPIKDATGKIIGVSKVARNITERKRVERRLQRSEANLAASQRMAHLGSWELDLVSVQDLTQGALRWSDEVFRIWGYEPRAIEVTYENFLAAVHPDDRGLIGEAVAAALRDSRPYDLTHRILRPDGAERIVRELAEFQFEAGSGRPLRMIGTVLDITEQRRAEASLTESEQRLELATASAHIGIWDWDLVANKIVWDQQMYALYGIREQDFSWAYDAWQKGLHPEDRERAEAENKAALAGTRDFHTEFRVRWPSGEVRHIEAHGLVRRATDGSPTRMIGVNWDITERKRTEARMRASEIRYRRLFESTKDGILVLDAETGMVMDANPFLIELLGFSHEEVLGKKVWELGFFKDIVANQDNFAELQEKEYIRYEDMALETSAGRRIEVEFTSNVFRINEQKVIQCSIRDISVRKAAEAEIHQLNTELEQRVIERTAQLVAANKELESFSYSVSHDLRAPLRAVNGFAKIVLDTYAPQLPAEARELLEDIRAGGEQMGVLIDDLLAFSRLGRQALKSQPVDTAQLVQAVLDELAPQRAGRPFEIKVGALPVGQGDPALLKQVWVNLISNAIKYTRGRTPAVIEIGCKRNDTEIIYFVCDNGAGFDMRYVHKLFGVFQRLHRAEEFEGTGVGLAIVQRIIHRHGGKVWAEAELGRGARFQFTLGQEK